MKKSYIIIGIALVAILVYLWWKNKNNAAVNVAAVTGTVNNPVTGQTTSTLMAGNGTIPVPSTVSDWINSTAINVKRNILSALPAMGQADISGLTNIVNNYFSKGISSVDPTTRLFWNNWYTKYNIFKP